MSQALKQTIPAPEMDDDAASVRRAAANGPVVITEEGRPAFVVMTHDDYLKLGKPSESILHAFEDPGPEADFDFKLPPRDQMPSRATPIDLE